MLPFHSIAGWTEAKKGSKVMGNKGWISEEKRAAKLGATNTESLEHVMKKVKENEDNLLELCNKEVHIECTPSTMAKCKAFLILLSTC